MMTARSDTHDTPRVRIHYRRPPDRLDVFEQELVVDRPDCKITLHESPPPVAALSMNDTIIFEPGAPIIWFIFPGAWHDVGRFHRADETFTGFYVNLIAPPEFDDRTWRMFDLCLDLWVSPDGDCTVMDQDEFDEAVDHGWIDTAAAARARLELEGLIAAVRAGAWPPRVILEHDLSRVRALSRSFGA